MDISEITDFFFNTLQRQSLNYVIRFKIIIFIWTFYFSYLFSRNSIVRSSFVQTSWFHLFYQNQRLIWLDLYFLFIYFFNGVIKYSYLLNS